MKSSAVRALTFDVFGTVVDWRGTMVAAHPFDLRGAKALGFKMAFIRRAGEEAGDPRTSPYVDVAVDIFELAGFI